MKIAYQSKRFGLAALEKIERANDIIADYEAQGYDLTLRQLYYQFVSKALIANNEREYKNLGNIINDARLAGLISWKAIVDRTRHIRRLPSWSGAKEIVQACAGQFKLDRWEGQEYRPEVFIEKDALVGVIEGICNETDVPYFSCRGYTSQSAMWDAAQRMIKYQENGQTPVIIHLGDHDPSGIDMSRDIQDRLNMFMEDPMEVIRVALTMDQVRQYNPPPNPTKLTDSRSQGYVEAYGNESWELDALSPEVITNLIRDEIYARRNPDVLEEVMGKEKKHKIALEAACKKLS